ncbi:MAG: M20/M25/M40 family metallo-hydrolase [Bdellovibrionia bacterium]
MKFIVLFLFSISFQTAGAHDDHDWRLDKAAFASVSVDTKNYVPAGQEIHLNQVFSRALPAVVQEAEFKFKLEELTGVREITLGGKPFKITDRGSAAGRELARQSLAQEYRSLGFQVFQHAYNGGANFIAEKPGTSGKVLIVSSHMDSVFNAGADDDGTGTIAALLIAKALKDVKNKHTLRILAFDNEEQGLVGSRAFVATLKGADIIGDIQVEMMGVNSKKDGKFHVIDCDRADSTFITAAIMQAVQSMNLPLTRVKACTDRSDHGSFWAKSMPAVVLSENFFGGDGDPCYHKKCDVVDARLDLKYSSLIATAVAGAAAKLIQ